MLDAGDAWVGQLISAIDRGRSIVRAMSLIGYDAMALGNHDYDWGQDELAQRAKEASFPFLTANVVDEATGAGPAFAKPYVVRDLGVARVAVIGLSYPSATIIKASSVKGLRFLPAVESVKRYLPEMRRQADIIVALSHLGLEGGSARIGGGDTALALAVPEIDLIIGGHDHLAFRTARTSGPTRIYQTGANGDNLGRVVGTATALFVQDRDMDNPLGNLVADALLDYGRAQGWNSDVAFYNAAGVRAAVGAGPITYGKLAEGLPFQNTVVSVDLTGTQLRTVFEGMAGSAGRLFMAGGAMAYRFANPDGQRVLRATVGGKPLDPARIYRVATIDYLLGGGDGHAVFTKGTNVVYGDVDVDAVSPYIQARSPVSPVSPGRVTQE